jgi:hypothetical protein
LSMSEAQSTKQFRSALSVFNALMAWKI